MSVNAEIPGIDLDRSYNIPVFATSESSRHSHHDISAQASAAREQESDAAKIAISSGKFDIKGLSRSLRFKNEGDRILLRFPMFRNKMLTIFAAIFGVGFGFVLERAGFGRGNKLAAQFYLTDMTVFKVMFSAIVTAMLGLLLIGGPAVYGDIVGFDDPGGFTLNANTEAGNV